MSEWYEPKDEDIDVNHGDKDVDIFVKKLTENSLQYNYRIRQHQYLWVLRGFDPHPVGFADIDWINFHSWLTPASRRHKSLT